MTVSNPVRLGCLKIAGVARMERSEIRDRYHVPSRISLRCIRAKGNMAYPGKNPRIAGMKKIAILIAKPMLHSIERSMGRLPR
jgi:hypothetical protein